MLFFVKVRIDVSKLTELGQKIQSGEFDAHPKSTYCVKDDLAVGLNIWEADDLIDFESKFAPHREFYTDVYEVTPIVTANEAQKLLVGQIAGSS